MEKPKVTILLFANGKLVCIGARKEREAYKAIEKIKTKLEKEKIIHHR